MSKTVKDNDKTNNANINCNVASVYVNVIIESERNHVFDTEIMYILQTML